MRVLLFVGSLILSFTPTSFGAAATATPRVPSPTPDWTLAWSDEFSSADGSSPDSAKWTYDLGGNGWGNQELETYTSRPQNVKNPERQSGHHRSAGKIHWHGWHRSRLHFCETQDARSFHPGVWPI